MAQWKPEDWQKFSQGYQEHAGGPTSADSNKPSIFQAPIDTALSAGKGALKEAVQGVESAPWAGQIPETKDSPSPVMSWARSQDKEHPWAEKAGRMGTDIAPSFMTPELSVITRLAMIARRSGMIGPMVARGINTAGQVAWKGGVGGAEQPTTNRSRATETGAGSALTSTALRAAYSALPPRWKSAVAYGMPVMAAIAAMESERGHWFAPWFHAAEAAAPAIGAGIAGAAGAPGIAGALGARAEDQLEPENLDKSNR